ncbi:hypothetical protein K0M31_001070 [Melipona bicolor]|uniref:Uncharacterized protein n=1 Tax=Melipona bicolor TaxID=60889 RepID=A0AA40KXF2_9HYME|nr:hypothetical protein K0M31_001070 [Melipona bicolor]
MKYYVNLHPLLSRFYSTCLRCMENNEFFKTLKNFITFKDNSGEIPFDEFNENSDDDKMMTAREHSGSSNEKCSDAINDVTMNTSLVHKNDIKFHIALEEQCTSSSTFPKQTEESEQNNFFHDKGNDHSFNDFSITSRLKLGRIEELKKRLTKFSVNIKKQKIISHEEKTESHIEHKNESKIQEGKRSCPQNDSTKYKSNSSKTSKKKLKRKNIKCKKTTQTDNYSSDDEVEVISIKAKRHRKRYRSRIDLEIRQFQSKNTNEELNYMADNEDSVDGLLQIRHKRIPLFQRTSSINSGFENRAETCNMNIIAEQWSTILPDRTNSFPRCSCASPSSQELRENPLAYIFYSQWMLLSLNDNSSFFPLRRMTTIPPAPSPMRHLYYEYPEFMTVPVYVDLSRILNVYNMTF